MRTNQPALVDYLLLTGLALVFGSSFLLTKVSVRELPPLSIANARLGLAAFLMIVFMLVQRKSLPAIGPVWKYIVASAFLGNALPFALITWGQVTVDASLAAILMAIMPLVTVVIAHIGTSDEKMNRYKLLGVLSGLVGVVVLMGWNQLGQLGDSMLRQYAIACAAVCYALNAIVTKKLTNTDRVPMIVSLLLVSTLMLLPFTLYFDFAELSTASLSTSAMLSILSLAIGPTAFATLLILVIIDRQGASFLSQINFLVPIFGVLLARLFLSEKLPANGWVALIIILFGIALSRYGSNQIKET